MIPIAGVKSSRRRMYFEVECMASKNKKRKAKNSFLYNGAEKQEPVKLKRIMYYNKVTRNNIKKEVRTVEF